MNEKQLKKLFTNLRIKDDMQQRLLDNCSNAGYEKNSTGGRSIKMKKFNRVMAIAASLAVVMLGFTSITYGQAIYEKGREIILGGYAQYVDVEYNIDYNIENETEINSEVEEFATDSEIVGSITTLTDIAEAQSYLAFNLKNPAYLPEGYTLDRIELYNDENGKPDGQYASVFFTKGEKFIYLQARLMNEETAFATGLGGLKEVEIDGYKGLMDNKGLDVDINGVMYMFSAGFADVDSDELVKMVESFI